MQLSFLQNMLSASVSGVHRKIINQSSNHLGDYCCDRQLMLKPNKKKNPRYCNIVAGKNIM